MLLPATDGFVSLERKVGNFLSLQRTDPSLNWPKESPNNTIKHILSQSDKNSATLN